MTTIKSTMNLGTLDINLGGSQRTVILRLERGPDAAESAFHTAELLEALDAVPKSHAEVTARAEILDKELESARKAARDESDRAEKAEAKLAEVRRELGYAEKGADEWQARAEAAEAKLERVRALLSFGAVTNTELRTALADPTPFELPTEAGARFEARHGGNDTTDEFLTVNCDGKPLYLRLASSCIYGPESVLGCFGHFRLIEADE